VEVVVLEARDRVGGRVHSYKGDFSAPVDLGASIITGTQVWPQGWLLPVAPASAGSMLFSWGTPVNVRRFLGVFFTREGLLVCSVLSWLKLCAKAMLCSLYVHDVRHNKEEWRFCGVFRCFFIEKQKKTILL
jgi:Flavin containing amine oxidoreductase